MLRKRVEAAREAIATAREAIKDINVELRAYEGDAWEALAAAAEGRCKMHRLALEMEPFPTLREVGAHQGALHELRAIMNVRANLLAKVAQHQALIQSKDDELLKLDTAR